jgi:hypothetical protein
MRIIGLTLFFVGIFYYFTPESSRPPLEKDILSVKESAPRRLIPREPPKNTPAPSPKKIASAAPPVTAAPEPKSAPADYAELSDEIPWEHLEKSWQNELKDFLIRLEPERGEKLYAEYLSEKDKYRAELAELLQERDEIGTEELSTSREYERLIENLGVKHQESIRMVFGEYFEDIKYRHQEFIDSIQYYNRSVEADYTIGVSL